MYSINTVYASMRAYVDLLAWNEAYVSAY